MTRQQKEWTLSLDASELAWSGALDGVPDAWPWTELQEESGYLMELRHAAEELALETASVDALADDEVLLRASFKVVDSWRPERVGTGWAQTFTLEGAPCPYGGLRWWFRCPVVGCGKRRAKLYRPWLSWWGCRECYGLTYTSRARYSGRTKWSGVWGQFNKLLDQQESLYARGTRANLRRRLSRWRQAARRDERQGAWSVQVTCRASLPDHAGEKARGTDPCPSLSVRSPEPVAEGPATPRTGGPLPRGLAPPPCERADG